MFRLVIFSCLFLAIFADSDSQSKPTEGRILGGIKADITEVPFLVSVQYENKHRCGGAVIGPRHILTAAHCVYSKRNHTLLTIRAGSNYQNKEGHVKNVEKVIIHPKYEPLSFDNDATVLILKEPLTTDDGVKIATLAHVEPQEGDTILIPGWSTLEKDEDGERILQTVELPALSKEVCRRKYSPENVTDKMFCAGNLSGGKDSCKGDSGSPAMVNNNLAGIVSWGVGCGNKDYPGVYTNIAKILSWVNLQIQNQ